MTNLGETLENQTTTNKTGNASSVACDTERLTNGNTSNKGNWLQSIPRRIRKLISKSNKKLEQVDRIYENIDEQNSTIDSATNIDGTDDSHLYSNVEYWNDEEVAMIRACSQMAKHGWFWGPISRHTAQQRLHGTPNGSFLVRNSQINSNNFSISFRTAGKTFHYRIEFVDGYWQTFSSKHRSIVDLIEDAMKKSKENVFCYVKQSSQLIPPFPVRLTNPISHFGEMSLQRLCRQVIQKNIDIAQMERLPLPNKLISYCKETDKFLP